MTTPLDDLVADGLEALGTITIGDRLSIIDPLIGLEGPTAGVVLPCAPGAWSVLGRAWAADRDMLEEVIAVHHSALPSFYSRYDEAQPRSVLLVKRQRLAMVDGPRARDVTLRAQMLHEDADALPWILDDGILFETIGEQPAQLLLTDDDEHVLISLVLAPLLRTQTARPPAFSDQ
ncbi:MAG: hypothetical protein AAFV53_26765 [Myxococcota bacterium]